MLSFFLPTVIGILQGSLCVATRLSGSQCSGGDLDGDDYTVIWAEVLPSPAYLILQDMNPENLNETAMNYTATICFLSAWTRFPSKAGHRKSLRPPVCNRTDSHRALPDLRN